jgi:hypothetical protein
MKSLKIMFIDYLITTKEKRKFYEVDSPAVVNALSSSECPSAPWILRGYFRDKELFYLLFLKLYQILIAIGKLMTSEIAILNKEAIALATDSAVTLSMERGQKIFTSANKLFSLSKYYPVGIMIYGNATFMGIPWETIIKIYRNELEDEHFSSLNEYAVHFLNFLEKKKHLFPSSEQDEYVKGAVYTYFHSIKEDIEEIVQKKLESKDSLKSEEVGGIVSNTIKVHQTRWTNAKRMPNLPSKQELSILKQYRKLITEAKKEMFEKLPLSTSDSKMLNEIALNLFVKFSDEVVYSGQSGVVIAGFGEKEFFPSLVSFLVEGICCNTLKYKKDKTASITFKNSASIIPFAQSEMVTIFMEGVDPEYEAAIESDLSEIFEKYPEVLFDIILKSNNKPKSLQYSKIKSKIIQAGSVQLKQYLGKLRKFRQRKYIGPVVSIVALLPKDELSTMAESLVSLTSFKRKVSTQTETVGGPVDVAVISKGDGFVWMRRKHYFKPEYNPQFKANYYMKRNPI